MKYYDFEWYLDCTGITLDKEINVGKLNWVPGDYFKLIEDTDGSLRLVKVDELATFVLNGCSTTIDNNKKRE
jgi:hypothetical protein